MTRALSQTRMLLEDALPEWLAAVLIFGTAAFLPRFVHAAGDHKREHQLFQARAPLCIRPEPAGFSSATEPQPPWCFLSRIGDAARGPVGCGSRP
jgi:hypothetical protein